MGKRLFCLIIGILLIVSYTVSSTIIKTNNNDDFDPLVDTAITVDIQAIRYLEYEEPEIKLKNIAFNLFNKFFETQSYDNENTNLYLKIIINGEEFTSEIYNNKRYIYNPDFSATLDVDDEQEYVNIKIQLWNSMSGKEDVLCDISGDFEGSTDKYVAEITYSIKTGCWTGDDQLDDSSGYGRLCGCVDGTIYEKDRDCELWFNIFQNDYDGDGITYWSEVNIYNTDPKQKNTGDPDKDLIPVEWELKWGYNPFEYDNHKEIDPDQDSINNYEEYLTSEWYSDPYRKDVFVEMDKMGDGPNGEKVYFPVNAKELIKTAFDRQNIVYHLDMGEMGGYEIIPFDDDIGRRDLSKIYYEYFLHGDEDNWRRGVFHYGLVIYYEDIPGYMFRSNAFQIASKGMEDKYNQFKHMLDRDIVYGSAYMHELGHTFAFNPIPGHDDFSKYPWQPGYWKNRPYKSCMNYAWMFQIVDYSDGSRQEPDIDDWSRINYFAFENEWH